MCCKASPNHRDLSQDQERLNGAADWSAAIGGQVLPHFEHIVSGALTPPCPVVAVF
jgi:hypothetical protein